MNGLVGQFFPYIYSQIAQYVQFLPEFLQQIFEKYGVEAVLEATYWLTESYIPQHFLDEMRGLADGSGLDYMTIVRVHMVKYPLAYPKTVSRINQGTMFYDGRVGSCNRRCPRKSFSITVSKKRK